VGFGFISLKKPPPKPKWEKSQGGSMGGIKATELAPKPNHATHGLIDYNRSTCTIDMNLYNSSSHLDALPLTNEQVSHGTLF